MLGKRQRCRRTSTELFMIQITKGIEQQVLFQRIVI